jgi:hypothetical protein
MEYKNHQPVSRDMQENLIKLHNANLAGEV